MTIKRVFVHVGMHKTGTSSIQETLFYNSHLLEREGFLCVKEWGMDERYALMNFFLDEPSNYYPNARFNGDNDKIKKFTEESTNLMLEAARKSTAETLIVSCEDLCILKPSEVTKIKPFFARHFGNHVTVNFIIYVRHTVDVNVSGYQQFLTWPLSGDWNVGIDNLLHRWVRAYYYNKIAAFIPLFQNGELHVVKFEDAIHDEFGLIGGFFNLCGVPSKTIREMSIIKSNESRSLETMDFLKYVHSAMPPVSFSNGQYAHHPNRNPSDWVPLADIKGTKFDIPYNLKIELWQTAQEDILWLKSNTGIDYTDKPPSPPTADPEPVWSAETIDGFLKAFPLLSFPLKKIFLDYFSGLRSKTGNEAFDTLCAPGSEPWKTIGFAHAFNELLREHPSAMKKEGIFYDGVSSIMVSDYAALYVDYGNDVHRSNMVKFLCGENSAFRISLSFNEEESVKRFRMDPSLYPCVMLLRNMTVNGRNGICKVQYHNGDDRFGNLFAFFRDNPCVVFTCSEKILTLEIEILVDKGSYAFSLCAKKVMANKRLELANARKAADQALLKANKTIAELKTALDAPTDESHEIREKTGLRNIKTLLTPIARKLFPGRNGERNH